MPVFVVSLFLPYTVDFQDLPPPPKINRLSPKLLTPATPAPSKGVEDFFAQALIRAATPPLDSQTLSRSDSYISERRGALSFRQPTSLAHELPASTVLGHSPVEEVRPMARNKKVTKSSAHTCHVKCRSGEKKKLGLKWSIEPAERGNGGLTNAIRAAERGNAEDVIWIGSLGFPTDSLDVSTLQDFIEKLESDYNALAVEVSDDDFHGHYTHYCKTMLWPVFHYQVPDHPKSKAYEDHSWIYYVSINQAFADKVVSSYKRGDIIWIHDYHLLLVPGMIRRKLPDAQIGFFLHCAFPSSEVFRCLSARTNLLEGMLGADLVAFQIPEYAEHFVTTCSRLLIVEATSNGVQLEDKFVNVAAHSIGIDPQTLNLAREEPDVLHWITIIQDRYKGKRLIVARDELDNIRGVREKMLAFELFLKKYPQWRAECVLIQITMSDGEDLELASMICDIVTRIDSQYSNFNHQPLVFLRQDITFSQYIALLSVADALMITSLREGMNLSCHEYIVCQDGKLCNKRHGPVILSEFTGSASVFGKAEISVNPWDYQQCADAIKTALEMRPGEKDSRYNMMRDVVFRNNAEKWVGALTKNLVQVYEEHCKHDTMSIPRLRFNQLAEQYLGASIRLFILDYEGTLTCSGLTLSMGFSSPQRVIHAINDLIADDHNVVYIMSSQMPGELSRLFSLAPGVGIIAENGGFLREFGCEQWIGFADMAEISKWKTNVKGILNHYQQRVEGSEIEERNCSLIFRYGKAEDTENAVRQAGECINLINDACKNQKLRAVSIENAILVESLQWSKASAATYIFDGLKTMAKEIPAKQPDFLFVAGDGREDEEVFRCANELAKSGAVKYITTVSMSKRNTEAMFTLTQGTTGLLSVLKRLVRLG